MQKICQQVIESHFNKEKGVLYTVVQGTISAEEMKRHSDEWLEKLEPMATQRIIEDSSAARPTFGTEMIDTFTETQKRFLNKFNIVRHAVVMDDPVKVAMAMLFDWIMKKKKSAYKMKVVSSLKSAEHWLMSDK